MAIRAARPSPGTGPPWPVLYRAMPSPAQYPTGPCRASPRAPLTAQARARGPVSCRAGPRKPGTTTQIGPPEAQKLKKNAAAGCAGLGCWPPPASPAVPHSRCSERLLWCCRPPKFAAHTGAIRRASRQLRPLGRAAAGGKGSRAAAGGEEQAK